MTSTLRGAAWTLPTPQGTPALSPQCHPQPSSGDTSGLAGTLGRARAAGFGMAAGRGLAPIASAARGALGRCPRCPHGPLGTPRASSAPGASPTPGTPPAPGDGPSFWNIPDPWSIPSPQSIPSFWSIPSPQNIPSFWNIPSPWESKALGKAGTRHPPVHFLHRGHSCPHLRPPPQVSPQKTRKKPCEGFFFSPPSPAIIKKDSPFRALSIPGGREEREGRKGKNPERKERKGLGRRREKKKRDRGKIKAEITQRELLYL